MPVSRKSTGKASGTRAAGLLKRHAARDARTSESRESWYRLSQLRRDPLVCHGLGPCLSRGKALAKPVAPERWTSKAACRRTTLARANRAKTHALAPAGRWDESSLPSGRLHVSFLRPQVRREKACAHAHRRCLADRPGPGPGRAACQPSDVAVHHQPGARRAVRRRAHSDEARREDCCGAGVGAVVQFDARVCPIPRTIFMARCFRCPSASSPAGWQR